MGSANNIAVEIKYAPTDRVHFNNPKAPLNRNTIPLVSGCVCVRKSMCGRVCLCAKSLVKSTHTVQRSLAVTLPLPFDPNSLHPLSHASHITASNISRHRLQFHLNHELFSALRSAQHFTACYVIYIILRIQHVHRCEHHIYFYYYHLHFCCPQIVRTICLSGVYAALQC